MPHREVSGFLEFRIIPKQEIVYGWEDSGLTTDAYLAESSKLFVFSAFY